MESAEREFDTLEGKKIYMIQNISEELKNNISESNATKAAVSGLYTLCALFGISAIAAKMNNQLNTTNMLCAFSTLSMVSGGLIQLLNKKYDDGIHSNFNKLKNELRLQKDFFTIDDKDKINKLKKSISKIKSNSDIIAVLEGIFFMFGTYLGGLFLLMARDNNKNKTIACIISLFYYLIDAGIIAINRKQNKNIKKNINSLENEISKPYTLIKK